VQHPRRDLAVVRTRTNLSDIAAVMGPSFEAVAGYLGPRGLLGQGPAIARYFEMDMGTGSVTVASGFLVARPVDGDGKVVPDELPAGEVATTTHMGAYDTLPEAYQAIAAAVAAQGRELDETTMWEEYWSPPGTPNEETRTEIFCPLKPAG